MASLDDYHGLQVVSPPPTGPGGGAIQDDLKLLVDWSPKSVWAQGSDPGPNNDIDEGYYPGSLWLRTSSPPRLFLCQSNVDNLAVWNQLLIELVQDGSPQLGADLDVNGKKLVSVSNGNIVLLPNGTGKIGAGSATPTSTLSVGGSFATAITSATATRDVAENECVLICDASAATFTLTLPLANSCGGRRYTFRRTNTGASKDVKIAPRSGNNIDGSSGTPAIVTLPNANSVVTLISDGGVNWWSI